MYSINTITYNIHDGISAASHYLTFVSQLKRFAMWLARCFRIHLNYPPYLCFIRLRRYRQ